jgi:hypothetical protein
MTGRGLFLVNNLEKKLKQNTIIWQNKANPRI